MYTKLPNTKGRILRYLVFLFLSFKAFSFDQSTFEKINSFFTSVNSNLEITQKDIQEFNRLKINSGFVTKKHNIEIPYFIFEANKLVFTTSKPTLLSVLDNKCVPSVPIKY